ncbi:MAG: hypothetical protein LIO57_08125 [Oscillospiraceae bacterium]|nr:hypothetical protein [Oscillospiraceae bacterium]
MTFFQALAQQPLLLVIFIVLALFITFWIFVSVAIMVSKRAREYFSSFFPQWFKRNGRPFTTHEKIGACFQLFALALIIALLMM